MAVMDKPEKLPITADEAADELVAAGRVVGLAQRAFLDLFAVTLKAREVQLQRELLHTAAMFGHDSAETATVALRLGRHEGMAKEIADAQARVAVPVPDVDKRAAVIFGRVADHEGASRGAVIEGVTPAGEVLATATSDKNGHYELRLDRDVRPDEVEIRVRPREDRAPIKMAAPVVARGGRLFTEIVLPDSGRGSDEPRTKTRADADAPKTAAGRARAATTVVVPNVVGAELEEAIVALREAGLNVGDVDRAMRGAHVTAQDPRAKTKAKPGTPVALKVGKKA